MAKKLLIINNKAQALKALIDYFCIREWHIEHCDNLIEAENLLLEEDYEPQVIIAADLKIDSKTTSRIEQIQNSNTFCEWILLLGQNHKQNLTQIDQFAYDYLIGPIDYDRLNKLVNRAERSASTSKRLTHFTNASLNRFSIDAYVGNSEPVKKLKSLLTQLKEVPISAMVITGETGTGKGLVAGIVHHCGLRKEGPFIELNCAALPKELLESQLFGHEAGAFTGAKTKHKGLFEQADGGTLFLDEIGDMDIELQAKLLKAIEEQKFRRLGSEKEVSIDVQIIAATGVNLEQAVNENSFRDDLYHRLCVFQVQLPPLRDRKEDLLELVPKIIAEYNVKANKKVDIISDQTWEKLIGYEWPGNVRELRNVLERCVLLSKDELLPIEWLQLNTQIVNSTSTDNTLPENAEQTQSLKNEPLIESAHTIHIPIDGSLALDEIEKTVIEKALRLTENNVTEAAKLLKTTRQTIRYRIQKYEIQ